MSAPETFTEAIGGTSIGELVERCVLALTYTAHDMAPFARELGYDGDPFPWDEEERRHLMARLDAVMFRLYGLDETDIEYILSTFPIIQRQDEERCGSFRTRDLIRGYFRAHAAGDVHSRVRA